MPKPTDNSSEHIDRYADGSVKGKGPFLNGQMHGYWEWFRQDGSKLRSGHLDNGKPVGEWTTYDRQSRVYKVTHKRDS